MGRRKLIEDEALLAVAREVFIEKGIAVSTREIARRAGISEAAIYQRHGTKANLFFRALIPPTLDIDELLQDHDDCSPLEHLEQIALGMLDYFREIVPVLKPLMNHPDFNFEEFSRRHPDAPLHRLRQGLMDTLQALQERGEIGSGPVGPAALTLFAALHSVAIFEQLGVHGGEIGEPMVRDMVRALWRGLRP